MHQFKELLVWQKAVDLVVSVYDALSSFPEEEKFGLSSQIKRAATSIPSNIAEGAGRNTNKDFRYFLSISKGSINELQTQLIIAQRLNLLSEEKLQSLEERIVEISKMLVGLMKTLEK